MATAAQNLYAMVAATGTTGYQAAIGSPSYNTAKANPALFRVDDPLWGEWATIYTLLPVASSSTNPSGIDTRTLQAALNRLPTNQARLAEDGNYGPKTRARVMEFQQQNGLPQTGAIDALTGQRILFSAAGQLGAPLSTTKTPTSAGNVPMPYTPPATQNKTDWGTIALYGGIALLLIIVLTD